MKELSIEEKAKAYDIALEKIEMLLGTGSSFSREELEYVFPELAESEDERIKDRLINYFHGFLDGHEDTYKVGGCVKWEGLDVKDVITWLEKQGDENIVVVIPKFRVGDVIRPKGSAAEYTIESISGECYHGKGWGLHISCDNDYELVEHKPAEWNEEDETVLSNLIWALREDMVLAGDRDVYVDWLKSLKDRVIPQPKNEWSEENESHIRYLIECLEHCKKGVALTMSTSTSQEYINWLKSLRPQSHWKPSDKQMKAIGHVKED